jgi:ATP phosphoribosyltransferase regulatory subunit
LLHKAIGSEGRGNYGPGVLPVDPRDSVQFPTSRDDGPGLPNNALPPGMRDLLPPEARFQSRVGRDLMATFELFGYERVWLPTFEYAEVFARSHALEGALKFVEPESGEVVALRSDMTPQIARVVVTRYGSAPRPVRLCYQGSVVRRRKERARTESQVVQAGVELVGKAGTDGDFEAIELLCCAVRAAGLADFVLDIGHSGLAASLIADVPLAQRAALREALAAKDVASLERAGRAAGLANATLAALVSLPELHGGAEIWPRAQRALANTAAAQHCAELQGLWQRAQERGLASRIVADLGETRDFDYYTGTVFQLLAYGPGEPLASGGRYDALYERFGAASPAAGFAIDLNHLCWALRTAGKPVARPSVLAVAANVPPVLLAALRSAAIPCAVADEPLAYAAFWRYPYVLLANPSVTVTHLETAESQPLDVSEPARAARVVAEFMARTAPASG